MSFRSLLIPIVLLQLLPSQGEDFSTGSFGNSFNDDLFGTGSVTDDLFGAGNPMADLLLSTVADSGMEKCFEGFNLNELMADPFATMGEYCKSADATKFNNALEKFETCAHFSLKEVIETIASASLGLALNCGSYFVQVADSLDTMEFDPLGEGDNMDPILSLPRVPDACMDALVGDNPLGNMILQANEYPERELACFADLAKGLPSCTLKEWPVPIVGNWLKSISCILGSAETMIHPIIEFMAVSQLNELSECLPAKINKGNCQEVLDSCSRVNEPIMNMYLPAPLQGAPLPEAFKAAAKNAGSGDKARFESTIELYEQYRQSCVTAEDRAIWERVPGKTSSLQKDGSANSSKTFLFGFLTGTVLLCMGFFVFSKMRGGSHSRNIKNNNIELNDLEFSTENRFT